MDPDSERDFAQRPSATDRERAGRRIDTATEIPAGWQGTPPAEGTRRALILATIDNFSLRLISGVGGRATKSSCLALADEIESALLQSTIDDEAMRRAGDTMLDGIENAAGLSLAGAESAKALNHLILARRECVEPAELARINEAITAAHMVVEPPAYAATAEAVRKEVGEEAPTDDVAGDGKEPGGIRRQTIFEVLDRLYKDKTQWPLTPAKVTDALEEALTIPGNLELADQARQALAARIEDHIVDPDQLIEIARLGE